MSNDSVILSKETIKKIQTKLGLEADGIIGPMTIAAIKNFQTKFKLKVSGTVDTDTFSTMFPEIDSPSISSDISENISENFIHQYKLPKGEFYQEDTVKKTIFIHHTAGWNNPYNVIDSWARDTRGRIGTHYVIGGINPVTGDESYDGIVLQCCDDSDWIHHLGVKNSNLDRYSIGIELCNFGYLQPTNNGYVTYTNATVISDCVHKLNSKFRNHLYWQDYSDKQLQSLNKLLLLLSKKHNIDIKRGLNQYLKTQSPVDAFGFKDDILKNTTTGLYTHTNVRIDKTDCYPNSKLVQLLNNL